MSLRQPERHWDEHDMAAEREAGHAPGHYNKRMRYRRGLERGLERGQCTDREWENMVNKAQ